MGRGLVYGSSHGGRISGDSMTPSGRRRVFVGALSEGSAAAWAVPGTQKCDDCFADEAIDLDASAESGGLLGQLAFHLPW